MATATGSRQPRRRNGDQLRREPKARNCQTKEILPPNCKSVQKNKNNSGLQSPFLLTRLVHFQAAIWHNLSPLLTGAVRPTLNGLVTVIGPAKTSAGEAANAVVPQNAAARADFR